MSLHDPPFYPFTQKSGQHLDSLRQSQAGIPMPAQGVSDENRSQVGIPMPAQSFSDENRSQAALSLRKHY